MCNLNNSDFDANLTRQKCSTESSQQTHNTNNDIKDMFTEYFEKNNDIKLAYSNMCKKSPKIASKLQT